VVLTFAINTLFRTTHTNLRSSSLKRHRTIVLGRNYNLPFWICKPILLIFYKSHEAFVKFIRTVIECWNYTYNNLSAPIHIHPSVVTTHASKPIHAIRQLLQIKRRNVMRSIRFYIDAVRNFSTFIIE